MVTSRMIGKRVNKIVSCLSKSLFLQAVPGPIYMVIYGTETQRAYVNTLSMQISEKEIFKYYLPRWSEISQRESTATTGVVVSCVKVGERSLYKLQVVRHNGRSNGKRDSFVGTSHKRSSVEWIVPCCPWHHHHHQFLLQVAIHQTNTVPHTFIETNNVSVNIIFFSNIS